MNSLNSAEQITIFMLPTCKWGRLEIKNRTFRPSDEFCWTGFITEDWRSRLLQEMLQNNSERKWMFGNNSKFIIDIIDSLFLVDIVVTYSRVGKMLRLTRNALLSNRDNRQIPFSKLAPASIVFLKIVHSVFSYQGRSQDPPQGGGEIFFYI